MLTWACYILVGSVYRAPPRYSALGTPTAGRPPPPAPRPPRRAARAGPPRRAAVVRGAYVIKADRHDTIHARGEPTAQAPPEGAERARVAHPGPLAVCGVRFHHLTTSPPTRS